MFEDMVSCFKVFRLLSRKKFSSTFIRSLDGPKN